MIYFIFCKEKYNHFYQCGNSPLTSFRFSFELMIGKLRGMHMRIGEIEEEWTTGIGQCIILEEKTPIGQQIRSQILKSNWLLDNL